MPKYTYLGLSDKHKAALIAGMTSAAAPKTPINNESPADFKRSEEIRAKELAERAKEIKEDVEKLDKRVAFGGYTFEKGKPVDVPEDDPALSRLEKRVKGGSFRKGEPKKASAAKEEK